MTKQTTKTIEITRYQPIVEMKEFTFPHYSVMYLDCSEVYIKTQENGDFITVTIQCDAVTDSGARLDDKYEISFGHGYDYVRNRDGYSHSSTEAEFIKAVVKIQAMVLLALRG